ncbi:uncharacterized protein LOC143230052 isoform X2 [Tachypleus tridentatus]|uniref:uncharacterized protein LOC143230052 isoform X2 n=1 Tax=Tachypleus tridentatus TaxID=6853 RepID=UPI003FCFEC6D
MPGTCKNSATLNKSCEECVSSADSGSSETSNSSLDIDPINSHNGCHSRDNSFESLASSGSSGSHSRQVSGDSTGGVGLKRTLPQGVSTPAINPLQFVKVKPCPLSQKAQEQIKLAKETKIAKEKVKEEDEEWQGVSIIMNLDSWRSRRKKVVEKVIKRVEEIRQIELDEQLRHQPNKIKTFSRMMEERSLKRKPLNLAIYSDQEGGYSGEFISDEERQQDVVQLGSDNENSAKDQSWKSEVFHEIHNEKYEQNGMNSQCFKHNRDDYFNDETSSATYMQLQEENILCSGVENSESSKAFCSTETGDSDSGSFVIMNSVKDSHAKCNVFGNVSPDNSNVVEKCPSEHNTERADDSLEFTTGTELLEEFSSSQLVTRNDQHKCDSIELNLHLWLRKDSGVKDFGFKMKESDTSFTVESVDPGSASDLAGLRVGDKVWAINGEKTKGRTHSSLVFAIKQSIYTGLLELAVWRQFSTEKEREKEIIGVPGYSETKLSRNEENTDKIDNKEVEMNSNNSFSEFENKTLRTGTSDSREPDIKNKTSFYETQSCFKVSGIKSSLDEQRTVKKPPPVPKKPKHVVLRKNSSTTEQTEVEENIDYPRNENSCVQKETFINDLKQLNIEVVTSFISEANIELGASVDCKTSDHQQSEDVTQPQPLGTCDTKWTTESVKCEVLQDQQLSNKVPSISILQELQNLDSIGKIENTTKVSSEKPFHENNRYLDKPFSIETVKQQGEADERDDLPVYSPVKEELGLSIVYQSDGPPGVHTSSTTILQEDLTQENTFNGRNIESESLSGGETEVTFNQEEDMKETFNLSNELPASPSDITEQMEKFVLDQLEQDDVELRNILKNTAVEPQDQLELDVQEFDSLLLDEIDISPCFVEPPKEKPPPPPIDSELLDTDVHEGPYTKLRNDDTKSVKKELLKRRSDFLGINPSDVQFEFDDTLIQPPPNIEDILISERQLQRQLACQSEPNENSVKTEELLIRKQETDSESEHYIGCNQNEETAQIKREIISNLEQQQEIDHKDRIVKDNQTVDAECGEYFVKGYDVDDRPEEERKSMLEGESDMVEQQMGREEEQPCKKVDTVQEKEVQQPYYRTDDIGAVASSVSCVYQKTLIQDQEIPPTFRHAPDHGLYRQKPFVHADSHSPTEESTWDREEMIRASRNPQGLDSQLVINTNRLVPDVGTEKGKVSPDSQSLVPEANIRRHENAAVHKRRSEPPVREQKYNINHWLIQEAEIRRIREKNEREKHRTPNIHQDVQNKQITPFQNGNQPVIRTNKNLPRPTSVPPPTPPKPSQVTGKVSSDQNLEDLFKSQSLGQVRRFSQGSSNANGGHNWISGFTQITGRDLSKQQDSVLSVSGKKRCCSCGNELGRGAAMIIESLQLFYHIQCFCCSVCQTQLGNGSCGTDVRVRNNKLHCQNCYSNDDGLKFSQV